LPVDLKFGDAFEVGGSKFAGVLLLGFEVRSIQSLGAAEEGVDAKFEVKRAEIQHRRIPKCPRESPPEWKSKAATSTATSRLNLEARNLAITVISFTD
jgi:hypothetical protein